jgi:hypothetical protein
LLQLDPGVAEIDIGEQEIAAGDLERLADQPRAEPRLGGPCGGNVGNDETNMMQPPQHAAFRIWT